jgi:Outer membrane lipoprotein-sorting protein
MADGMPIGSPGQRHASRRTGLLLMATTIFLGCVALPSTVMGLDAAREGPPGAEEIMTRVNARPRGEASRARLRMILHSARGEYRKQIVSERARLGTGYRTAYWITAPEHEREIGLLLSEDAAQAGMWLYFPATRQTLHVVSRGLSALASDFSCEDLLTRISLDDYIFSVLGYEKVGDVGTYRIEMKPASERLRGELGFANSIGWVRDDIWMIVRADYLDDAGDVFKTFLARDIEKVDGIWTARTLTMENLRAKHGTEVQVEEIEYLDHLPGEELTLARFSRGLAASK